MHTLTLLSTVAIACCISTTLAAAVPVHSESASLAVGTQLSPQPKTLKLSNLTTIHPWPWPKAPWVYNIPGHSPQHLLFEEISSENTGLDGQQSTLHACDEIVRWLWDNYKEDQIVDHPCMQKISFNGGTKGSVVMVFVPITKSDVIDRETALDSMRSLENLIWRYGGQTLECEIWSDGKVKGRISIVVKVFKANVIADSDTVTAASRM